MRLGNVYYGTVHLSRLARPCRRGPSPVYAASLGRKTRVRGVRGRAAVHAPFYGVPNMFDSLGVEVPYSTWWR